MIKLSENRLEKSQVDKKILRKEIIFHRDNLSLPDRQKKSQAIKDNLSALLEFSCTRTLMIYLSFASEVITEELISYALREKKRVVVPVVEREQRHLKLSHFDQTTQLVTSCYGIKEPGELKIIHPDEVEMFILPGVAFDEQGTRLGYGGGYFDRLLEAKKDYQKLVGIAYELQMHRELPRLPHDVFMNVVVTEEKVRYF